MEAAIYEDCHTLIEEFVNEGSVAFQSFCSKWKSMMFHHMYSPQTSVLELIQTTCAIFHMAKRSICAKDEFGKYLSTTAGNEERNLLRRIGGLYLMYAVYFKQPTKEYVKVCVSLDTWREMVTFIESLILNPEMDGVRYIFWRLYKADAFRFAALDYCLGLEELADYDKITEEHSEVDQTEVVRVKAKHKLLLIPEIQETLKEMTVQEEQYNLLKRSITKSERQAASALPPTKIFQNIQNVFNDIQSILDDTFVRCGTKNNSGNSIRRELKRKAKAMKDCAEALSDSIDETSSEENSQQPHKKSNIGGTAKRSRHMKTEILRGQELPDYVNADLQNSSSDEEDDTSQVNKTDEEDTTENSNSASTSKNPFQINTS